MGQVYNSQKTVLIVSRMQITIITPDCKMRVPESRKKWPAHPGTNGGIPGIRCRR